MAEQGGSLALRAKSKLLLSVLNGRTPLLELVRCFVGEEGAPASMSLATRWRWATAIAVAQYATYLQGEVYGGMLRDIHAG